MKPLIDKEFLLANLSTDEVLDNLRERFTVTEESESKSESWLIYWDTFDWRLFKSGTNLVERPALIEGRELHWCDLSGTIRQRVPLDGPFKPSLADELPTTLVDLAPSLSMRRLLPMVRIRIAGSRLRLLGDESKTVARLRILQAHAARDASSPEHALIPRLRLEPIRGYHAEEARVLEFLAQTFDVQETQGSLFEAALEALGRQPGDYSSKVALTLDPKLSALEAACAIHGAMIDAMSINEDGMRHDLDSEFLHDFRVAVRRTRSALSQIKGVFAEDVLEHFKREFAWLGQITGPTRDLDVYQLKIPAYRAELPAEAARDLKPLEEFLATKQRHEHKRLVASLDTARYRDLVDTWSRQITSPSPGTAAELPVSRLASARIWKLYRRIRQQGLAIDDATPAAALHEVRIMGKKLRYLMEFFRSLYPQGPVSSAIRELKRLQDNLGDFNDYEVQQLALQGFAEELIGEKRADTAATLLAMGRLQAHLHQGLQLERQRFGRKFERFASSDNHRRFRELFKH